jgi:hypothetical protein
MVPVAQNVSYSPGVRGPGRGGVSPALKTLERHTHYSPHLLLKLRISGILLQISHVILGRVEENFFFYFLKNSQPRKDFITPLSRYNI